MSQSEILHEKLTNWWKLVQAIKANSTAADFEKVTSYLADDCIIYFNGMVTKPARGKEAVIETLKALTTYWKLIERRVTAQGADESGNVLFASMYNRLEILGEPLDFYETEVVRFNEAGLIEEYELYCDSSPIKAIFQEKQAK